MTSLSENGSVEFRFYRADTRDVSVTGDFTAWSAPVPMESDANGWWTLKMKLDPGEYRFRYLADGQWFTDFAANGVEVTKVGWNSVLVVPKSGHAVAKISQPRNITGGTLRVAFA